MKKISTLYIESSPLKESNACFREQASPDYIKGQHINIIQPGHRRVHDQFRGEGNVALKPYHSAVNRMLRQGDSGETLKGQEDALPVKYK